MGCTPILSVKKEEMKTMTKVSKIDNLESEPLSMAHPNPNGIAMLTNPTLSAILAFFLMNSISTSNPTKNKNKMTPKLAIKLRSGIEGLGKQVDVKLGIRPKTEGPKRIPAMTSEMTRGCLIKLIGM
ncbi:hypothetical protein WICPIJ_006504 [Wickerhamomyces pijperi]|uniref:Uncharacterized protein n=1 Tax=Wickerhamomyces pijperi TaxID=599730 RepID=A0A9P8TKT7_WICPI|nr:hypothetical protein WICPIJ_006504 [Wickerhamomyces pijperi]